MVAVWEVEVQRARTWLRSRQRAANEQRSSMFLRINSQIAFMDHQRALRCSQEEDGEDLAVLNFFSDVNADDVSAILQEVATTATDGAHATTAVVATAAATSTVSSVDSTLKPIEMPSHLIASPPKKTPQRYGGGVARTVAKPSVAEAKPQSSAPTVAPTTLGMTLSSDDNVKELMADLQLNVHVPSDAEEERKTEESTPPHAIGYLSGSISAIKEKARRAGLAAPIRPNGMHTKQAHTQKPHAHGDASNSSNKGTKKLANPVDTEAAASEMLSWVSGLRDPTVVKRKECLAKRNRKRTRHFGTSSAEEQRDVQRQVKHYTQASDSDSDELSPVDDNDYSPSEDPVDFEPEDPVDKDEMLSDDYLDSDDESLLKKRKRLKRQKKSKPAKRKAKQTDRGSRQVSNGEKANAGQSTTADKYRAEPTTIDLRSSDTEEDSSVSAQPSSGSLSNGSSVPLNGKSAAVPPGQLSKSPRTEKQVENTKDKSTAVLMTQDQVVRESEDGYETPELHSDGGEDDKENASTNASALNSERTILSNPPGDEFGDRDGEISDTGTVDFDSDREEPAEDQSASNSTETPSANTNDSGGDVSDAETVVLDEEASSDDLGLNYSDDSDRAVDPADTHEKGSPLSTPGVQQFFDYKPLKPRKPVNTRKVIPVHRGADFVTKKALPAVTNASNGASADPTKSVGSNGLRSKKTRPIETSVTMKGKHPVVRRSIKVLDKAPSAQAATSASTNHSIINSNHGHDSSMAKQRYGNSDRPTGSNGLRKPVKNSNRVEASESQDAADGESSVRYLSYSAPGRDSAAKRTPAKSTPTATPSRYGGGGASSTMVGVTALHSSTNGTREHQFRRDPQIGLYEALHIDGKEEDRSFMDRDAGYKRPSAFKKLQAEATRTGVSLVTSKEKEPDWDRIPIPKKGISFTSGIPESRHKATESSSRLSKNPEKVEKGASSKNGRRYNGDGNKSSRDKPSKKYGKFDRADKKQRGRPSNDTKHSSYYGPRSDDMKSRGDRRRSRSPPSPRYSSKRYDDNDSRGKKRRGSSRSSSPRGRDRDWDWDRAGRDKKSSRQRSHSPSPGGKRSRSNDRDAYRSEESSRNPSRSPRREYKQYSSSGDNGSYRDADARDYEKRKKQRAVESSRGQDADHRHRQDDSPPPGALSSFDGEDVFISESDPEVDVEMEKQEDIRFDLESVAVDLALMARRVYVTGLNPTISGEELEEIFAKFNVETDRETGYLAIDVFTCQRTFKSRGDACVTFLTEDGAAAAVEDLHAKHVKSSLIGVQLMDVHTQRILNAQFEFVRDTWKCPGTRCRAEVSTWDNACPRCRRKRCFGPSHHKITRDSWLCSICFTANERYDNSCKGCGECLPETGRFESYRS